MLNVRCIEIQIIAHVGILGFSGLKIPKVPNYQMFKDKLIPIIAKVSREFMYATHKNKTKMKHEHTKCYSTRDITTAWSCRGRCSTINTCRKDKRYHATHATT